VSHGVFLSHKGRLWAFMGAFYDRFQRTHTRAYTLNETPGTWEPHGVVIDAGFWPMQEPQRMGDGNWIMAGARVAHGYEVAGDLPAVAVSHGDDLTGGTWWSFGGADLGRIWGESTVIVEGGASSHLPLWRQGACVVSFRRTSGAPGLRPTSNLPMATSKPYAAR
jgi:hypothetical protein